MGGDVGRGRGGRSQNLGKLWKITENCGKSQKIVEISRKLLKITENCRKLRKSSEMRVKIAKIFARTRAIWQEFGGQA